MSTLFDMDESPVASTGDNEWYTPAYLIEAARKVMGSIYMDPASCPEANQTVRAQRIYTKEQNGLQHPWAGPLWLNPPFGRVQTPGQKTNQGLWVQKLVREHETGNVAQAILLTTCRPDTQWFPLLWNYPICFTDRKIGFYVPSEGRILQEHSHAHGTLLVYLGLNIDRFVEHFTEFGPVVTPDGVHRRPSPITQPSLFQ